MRATVDVLTLSATPIPRTLQMSLMGVRDLSLIQTAPQEPHVDQDRRRAGRRTRSCSARSSTELDRGGQVYYVHNRIESIYGVARALEQLVPKARIAVGHGQMHEHELEPIMAKFIDGEIDVLRLDDDHRERHRHPQRQHDHRQRRRQVRPGAALPVARPGRPLEPSGVRVSALPGAQGAERGRQGAARSDSRVHPPGLGPADRDARPRDSRRRQPARRRAVRLHRRGRVRDLRAAARRRDRRAQRFARANARPRAKR